ncbi:hypothetical protein JVU11DRAFT_7870 [Chiua virens]|nr:hypothetical protein JVU11DRAFT_7870 [Chiua virens]
MVYTLSITGVLFDTFDYAHSVGYLKIGVFVHRICTPGVRAEEFSKALLRVTGGGKVSLAFNTAVKCLQEVWRAEENGRRLACTTILEIGINSGI